MRDAGGLLVVLNGFAGGNLADELRRFREELLFADLEIVTQPHRQARAISSRSRGPPSRRKSTRPSWTCSSASSPPWRRARAPRPLGLKDDEEKAIRSFQLLTLKPELVLVNIGDDGIGKPLPAELLELAPSALQAPAKLELELDELSEEDRKAFMQDLGLAGFSKDEMLRRSSTAWATSSSSPSARTSAGPGRFPRAPTAVEGAGEIHTDLARGFVRGEVVSYDDFKKLGSMKEAKQHGVYRLESKTYVVQDGDIMHILASHVNILGPFSARRILRALNGAKRYFCVTSGPNPGFSFLLIGGGFFLPASTSTRSDFSSSVGPL